MPRVLPPLLSLRAFEAAARHLSFTKAAAELCVTQGAISRHIRNLEETISRRLFKRGPRGVELTPFGARYFDNVREAFDLIEGASRSRVSRSTAVITLDVMQSVAVLWLLPLIAEFGTDHPRIELRVETSMEPVDFSRDSVDLAIRLGTLPGAKRSGGSSMADFDMVTNWRGVHADYLCADVLTPVCHRSLAQRHLTPGDIAQLPLVHNFNRPFCWNDWFDGQDVKYGSLSKKLESGHFFMALEMARKNQGVALLPSLMLNAGTLGRELVIPCGGIATGSAYYILGRETKSADRFIRIVVEWIKQQVPGPLKQT